MILCELNFKMGTVIALWRIDHNETHLRWKQRTHCQAVTEMENHNMTWSRVGSNGGGKQLLGSG